ncbi:MAG: molybdopterin converting factor subunit 1 [Alphaproteobacteria bacterium]
MQVLYFGWVKSKIGIGQEQVSPPDGVESVGELIDWLKARGGGYEVAFADAAEIRAAVNHEIALHEAPIKEGDEVALFPPMTGG